VLDVTEAEAAKLLATLDPLAAMAEASEGKLRELLAQVSTSSDAVASMLENLAVESGLSTGAPAGEDDDVVPDPPQTPVSQRGDVWKLGRHRLMCGDSTSVADMDTLMAGARAALVATDPPYLVDYTGERPDHDGGNTGGKDWSATYREVDISDAETFFRGVFTNVLRVVAPGCAIYCWHAHKRQGQIARIWSELGILDHQQIVWVKPTAVCGRVFWHFRHEPCMMGWVKGSPPPFDGDHTVDSVWQVDWEGKARVVGNKHPTQKPIELFSRPMRKHTHPGDIVLEPFSGSGSQLIAAEKLKRVCHAMELEPVFVDVAIERWQALTGERAVHEATGRTFERLAAERLGAGSVQGQEV
jgi:DNA modification methylase